MTNRDIAEAFDEVADLLEFQAANPFRVRAYRNAARKLKDYPEPLAELVAKGADLTEIEGVGKDLADKIAELVQSGRLAALETLRSEVPPTVLPLMRIPGLGPKKAATLLRELGVQSLEMLRAACEAGRVRTLKGFGEKTEKTLLAGIALAEKADLRAYWADVDPLVRLLLDDLRQAPSVHRVEAAGSYRRGRETIGDVDLLCDAEDHVPVMDRLAANPEVAATLARGDTKMSVRLKSGLQVDLRVVPTESFGAALQYFTGSKDHNVELRGRARDRGLKLSEWGVFRLSPQGEEGERVAGADEEGVYRALGLPLIPPELREARGEIELAERDALPKLVELSDLRGDLHMHTTASDGSATLREMADAALERGLEYIAVTDHSQRVSMAGGLDPQRLRAQWSTIDELNAQLVGLRVLKGIECDILEAGGMDLPDDVLAEADWVIASLHYGQRQPQSQIMDRLLGAIRHPSVAVIAHPTGRLINRREAYAVAVDELIAAAAEHGKLLEINANPARLDLDDVHAAAAKRAGVRLVISSDAHSVQGLGVLKHGVTQARRAGLTAGDVANTLSLPALQRLLGR